MSDIRGKKAQDGGRYRTRRSAIAALLGVLAVLLGLTTQTSSALQTHIFEASFGPDGTSSTHFQQPLGTAVDQSNGTVYIGDAGVETKMVERFNSFHESQPFTGMSPSIVGGRLTGFGDSPFTDQIAVSPVNHDLYFASGGATVNAYQSDGEPANFTAGPGSGTNEIAGSDICGVAVNSAGDIYVSEWLTGVRIFSTNGELLTSIASSGTCQLAVDSHGSVYLNVAENQVFPQNSGPVEKFTASEAPPVSSSTTYESAGAVDAEVSHGVAVDASNNRFYADEGNRIAEYDEAGNRLNAFGRSGTGALQAAGQLGAGLAVNDSTGQVYVAQGNFEEPVEIFGPLVLVPDVTTGAASEVSPKGTVTLNGTVNPDGVEVTDCHFDFGTTEGYGLETKCEQIVGSGGEMAVTARLTGLTPGMTYHFRLQASNHEGTNLGEDQRFETPPQPVIKAASASNLTSSSADLSAEINPGGVETTCTIEYGVTTSYSNPPLPCEPASLGTGTTYVAVAEHLSGLSHDMTYHWRLVASSEAGTTTSADHTFIYDTTGEVLPDHRAYEMVTPPHKNAALVGNVSFTGLAPDFSEDGEHLILPAIQCFHAAESCDVSGQPVGEPFLFSRTSAGWVTTALAPPASQFEVNHPIGYSAATQMALFEALSPLSSEMDFYLRRPDGLFVDTGPATPPRGSESDIANSDFSRVIYSSSGQAYEFAGDGSATRDPVGVSGDLGSTDLISGCGTDVGNASGEPVPGIMSQDGETVYFTVKQCASGTGVNAGVPVPADTIYARIGLGAPVKISERSATECVTETCRSSPPAGGNFAGASLDGSKAFFISSQQLMDSASDEEGPNIYEYDFDNPSGRQLLDVSAGDMSGHGPRVQGVVAICSDGSHIYFVATAVLTASANGLGQRAQDGAENMYLFERDATYPDGHVAFVAQLPEADHEQWNNSRRANVTPDGRFLVFESEGDLTPDDTRTDSAQQIFLYDAKTGGLRRISVGERGFNDNGNAGVGNAKTVLGKSFRGHGAARSDPTMSHDGSFIFFESPVGLTPHALNDVRVGTEKIGNEVIYAENIYEWHDGHVFLISDGRDTASMGEGGSESAVGLLGSDATGHNVFFRTADPLAPADTDTQIDWYDARICEPERGSPCISRAPSALPPCLGEVCHGTPAETPSVSGAPTVTLAGQGNLVHRAGSKPSSKALTRAQRLLRALRACRKKKHDGKRRRRCEASVRKAFGASRSAQAGRGRSNVGGK